MCELHLLICSAIALRGWLASRRGLVGAAGHLGKGDLKAVREAVQKHRQRLGVAQGELEQAPGTSFWRDCVAFTSPRSSPDWR